ncbi:MAG: UDP-N-acetylglucosamine 2-epimerase (non-hydrolyzing) [Planctomycetes bacterium]|nr:UDP-N-acetylglucosamine 2-epimerase (non-hydrolyzing) [Planctomycetota bacterium]
MSKLNIVTIVGARPQFIKAAAVSRAVASHNNGTPAAPIVEKIVHTGQHYDENMSQVFFDQLDIPRPHLNLDIGSGTHGAQTGRTLEAIERVLLDDRPDWCLVYGDTNSTLAGALAAAKLHVPVAHVEAGLRSFNRLMPEEVNRVLTDHVSDLLFCPTDAAVTNLADEGIARGVCRVGDVMYDCALHYAAKAEAIEDEVLATLGLRPKGFFLATVHRAENTDDPERLRGIFAAFEQIATPQRPVVLPLHPRTRNRLEQEGLDAPDHVRCVEPVPYLEMVCLEKNAAVILTDSGGVQKEAYFYRVPCVTLRDETEWVETTRNGCNRLAGAEPARIVEAVAAAEGAQPEWLPMYGGGAASDEIIAMLLNTHKATCADGEGM